MTSKTLVILAGATIVIAGGAYLVSSSRSGGVASAVSGGNQALFPELEVKGDGVTAIRIRSGADETLVHKTDKGWTIASRDDYPADLEKVRALVAALAGARIAETKTSKPDFYERLGVQDVDVVGSTATLVTLQGGDAPLASLIVGVAPTTRGDTPMPGPLPGVFARKAGDAQVVLLDKNIEVPKGAMGWIKTDVLALDGARVQSALYKHAAEPAGEAVNGQPAPAAKPEATLTLNKSVQGGSSFEVAEVPEGRALRSPTAPAPIATVLSYVTIEDAASAKVVEGLTPVSVGTFKTFDGLVVTAKLFVKDAKNWLTLAATYEAPPRPEVEPEEETEKPKPEESKSEGAKPDETKRDETKRDETKKDETKKDETKPDPKAEAERVYNETAAKVQKEVADLNARLGGWAFQIPDFKAKQLRTRVEDLLVELAPTEAAQPAGSDGSGSPGAPGPGPVTAPPGGG